MFSEMKEKWIIIILNNMKKINWRKQKYLIKKCKLIVNGKTLKKSIKTKKKKLWKFYIDDECKL